MNNLCVHGHYGGSKDPRPPLGKDGGVLAHTEEEGDWRWFAFPMMHSVKWKACEWVGTSRQGRSGRLPMNSWGGCMKLWSPSSTRTIGTLVRTCVRLR